MTPYVGEIRMFAGNFAPAGWMFCQGQTLPISENDVLFQLIGITYGGDGDETFNLPNLSGRVPVHMGYSMINGEMGGTESVTLTTQQIPNHNHPLLVSSSFGQETNPQGNVFARTRNSEAYLKDTPSASLNAAVVSPVGGSQPHENMQPFLVINFIISLFGIFPSQT